MIIYLLNIDIITLFSNFIQKAEALVSLCLLCTVFWKITPKSVENDFSVSAFLTFLSRFLQILVYKNAVLTLKSAFVKELFLFFIIGVLGELFFKKLCPHRFKIELT